MNMYDIDYGKRRRRDNMETLGLCIVLIVVGCCILWMAVRAMTIESDYMAERLDSQITPAQRADVVGR